MTREKKVYLCEQIAIGRPVSKITQDEGFGISQSTVNLELKRDPEFLVMYARAREAAIEPKMEEIEDIIMGRGEYKDLPVDRMRELVSQRRWDAIRLQRYRYGDKIDVDVQAKVQVEGRVIDAEALDIDQLLAVRQALLAASGGDQDAIEADYEVLEDEEDEE